MGTEDGLARHHDFAPATFGTITCRRCNRTYNQDTFFQALIDPCGNVKPILTETQARAMVQEKVQEMMEELYVPAD